MKQRTYLHAATEQIRATLKYVLIFSLASNLLMLALPLYSMQVLDRVLSSASLDTLLMLTILTVALVIFLGLFHAVRSFTCAQLGEWLETTIAPTLFGNTIEHAAQNSGLQGNQNMRDLATLKQFLTSPGFQTIMDAPWAPVFLLAVLVINPWLGFLCLLGGGILLFLAYLTESATREPTSEASRSALESFRLSDAAIRHAETLEAMGMTEAVVGRWANASQTQIRAQYQATGRGELIAALSKTVRLLLQIGITGIGALLALQGKMTVGEIIATSTLSSRALAPFEAAISLWKTLTAARESYRRINESLIQKPLERSQMAMPTPTGLLRCENLFYRAPGSQRFLLRNIDFTVAPGTCVGIIGPSAAGKTTLAKLLAGIHPPSQGALHLDGAELYHRNRADIGRYLGYLPQEPELLPGTIRDNIARFQPTTDEDVIAAAQMAGAHDMILRLPSGYDTLAQNGALSPGQKQRVALARALFGTPRYLVLDEPNSHLDGEGEMALLQALRHIRARDITCMIVAHKPSIIAQADHILMLRDGTMEAFGERDQVLPRYSPAPRPPHRPAQPQNTLLTRQLVDA